MRILKVLIVAAILLFATQAHATILFDDFSIGTPGIFHADWIGENTFVGGVPGIYIVIGDCSRTIECTYDNPIGGFPNLFSSQPFHGTIDGFGRFNYFPSLRQWTSENGADTLRFRNGIYCQAGTGGCFVPEPSPIWLILAGAALIAVSRCRYL